MSNYVNIAICDDDMEARRRLMVHISKFISSDIATQVFEYDSGEALLTAITMKRQDFSLIFLDIIMKKLNGYDTARRIRELNDGVILVFYTGYCEPSPHCFEVQPYRYIMKNMTKMEIDRYVRDSMKKMYSLEKTPVLEAKMDGTRLLFKMEEIVYIEKYKKNTKLHISEEAGRLRGIDIYEPELVIRITDKLDELYCKLVNFGFGRPHDSYIINFKYMVSSRNDEFKLKGITDTVFRITRSKATEFNRLRCSYINSKNGDKV